MKRNCIGIVLLSSLLALTSCAPMGETTRAQATVQRPDLKNEDIVAWREYYQDQFEVHGSELVPPSEYYPPVAKQAYTLEKELWQKRAEERGTKRAGQTAVAAAGAAATYVIIYVVAGLAAALLLALIL